MAKSRVMIVEPSSLLMQVIRFSLSRMRDVEFVRIAEPASALNELHRLPCDVIVLGSGGVGFDTSELVSAIRQNEVVGDISICLLCSISEELLLARSLDAGADAFVMKPLCASELVRVIRTLLDRTSPDPDTPSEDMQEVLGSFYLLSEEVQNGDLEARPIPCPFDSPVRVGLSRRVSAYRSD